MKLSLVTPVLALALITGCGQSASDPAPAPPPVSAEPAPAPTAPPEKPVRTFVEKRALSTTPHDLVVDPEFQSLWTPLDETGYGLYEAYVEEGERDVRFEPSTPTTAGGAVLTVRPVAGGEARLTMTVTGGAGPLTARVWVSAPPGGRTPEVQLASLYDNKAIQLEPVAGSEKTLGGVTWVELRGASAEAMPGQLYLVGVTRGAGETRFHAPEVLSGAIPKVARSHVARTPLRAPSAATVRAARAFEAMRASHVTFSPPPRPPLRRR